MSHVLSDLSLATLLPFSLVAFCVGVAVLGGEAKAKRAMAVLRMLLLRKRRP